MTKQRVITLVICVSFLIFAHYHISIVISKPPELNHYKEPKPIVPFYKKNENPIWISMGLCFDKKTKLYDKGTFTNDIRYLVLQKLETDAKKDNRSRNRPIIKIHIFDPIIMKLCQN